MAILSAEELKEKFKNQQKPTGVDFANLIDSCLNDSLRTELLNKIELTEDDLSTIITTVKASLSAEDDIQRQIDTMISTKLSAVDTRLVTLEGSTLSQAVDARLAALSASFLGHATHDLIGGLTQTVQVGDIILTFNNGLVVSATAVLAPTQTPTPTPTVTTAIYKGEWLGIEYTQGDLVCLGGELYEANSPRTDSNDRPGVSIHWTAKGIDSRCPTPTPTPTVSPTPTVTPTPSPTPTHDASEVYVGDWTAQAYPHKSVVSKDDKLWITHMPSGTEPDDVPGVSNHWTYVKDEDAIEFDKCFPTPTPSPTPTVTPTPTPTPTVTFLPGHDHH